MQKLEIAVICDYRLLPSRVGGMDYFFWGFDAYCKSRGHNITWFFPNLDDHGQYGDLKIVDCNGIVENGFLNYNRTNKDRFDRIVTHFVEICTPFFEKVKQSNKDSYVIAVDHNPRPIEGYPFKKRLQKVVKGILYSRYIDLFVGVSQYTVNELIKDFGTRISRKTKLVYNGILTDHIETSDRRRNRGQESLQFLTIAHLRYSKGIQDLLIALSILKKKNLLSDIQFDLYGDGPYRTKLEEIVKDQSLESNVNFKGSVSDLNHRFPAYHYMVLPTYMECFSLAILESLAANIPVITTTVGGNMEAVMHGENGFIYKEGKIEELTLILEKLISGQLSIETDIHQVVRENFSIDNMISNHYQILQCT